MSEVNGDGTSADRWTCLKLLIRLEASQTKQQNHTKPTNIQHKNLVLHVDMYAIIKFGTLYNYRTTVEYYLCICLFGNQKLQKHWRRKHVSNH